MRPDLPRLVAITDRSLASEALHLACYERLARLLPPGAFAVQLREPGEGGRALAAFGERLLARLAPLGVPLFVNDRLDVALALGARHAHLGSRSVTAADARRLLGPGAQVTRACHSLREVAEASEQGADGALLSPIFASPGKGPPIELTSISAAAAAGIPLLALGGVDAGNASACLRAGAVGVAVIRAALDERGLEALALAVG